MNLHMPDVLVRGASITAPPVNDKPVGRSLDSETAFTLWPGSAIIAHYLIEAAEELQLPTPSILELGAGTGLAGLAAAAALQQPTTFTDLGEVLPQIHRNTLLNEASALTLTLIPHRPSP